MKKTVKNAFIASVREDHLDHIEEVAEELRTKGFEIKQVLKLTGVITGTTNQNVSFEKLKIKGIASIEKQRVVRKK